MKKSLRNLASAASAVLLLSIMGCQPHAHTFSDKWSKDSTHHWHAASCCDTDQVSDYAEHDLGSWKKGKRSCSICGYEESCRHQWNYGTETTPPACNDIGKKTYTCKLCGHTYSEDVAATGMHVFAEGKCKWCNDSMPTAPDTMLKLHSPYGDFYMSNTELTYARWCQVYQWATSDDRGESKYVFQNLGREGSSGTDGDAPSANSRQPVTNISFRDAVVWCNAASELEGLTPVYWLGGTTDFSDKTKVLREAENYKWDGELTGTNKTNGIWAESGDGKAEKAVVNNNADGYRLPEETAEWVFAAKGGEENTYSGSSTIDDVAWYAENSSGKTHDVGTKNANAYGMYDMSGNVSEWFWLSVYPTVRCLRSGSYKDNAVSCSLTFRDNDHAYEQYSYLGFRVARSVIRK